VSRCLGAKGSDVQIARPGFLEALKQLQNSLHSLGVEPFPETKSRSYTCRSGRRVAVNQVWGDNEMVQPNSARVVSRDGVNTTRLFFEHYGCTFQEIDQQQDVGKDVYVDLADAAGFTPLCVALQVKSGASYRAAKGDYAVPVDHHADLWRRSTVPVFGIVHDPEDAKLRWVDLTGYLRAHPDQIGGSVPVSGRHTLDELSLRGAFAAAVSAYGARGTTDLVLNLLSPEPFQIGAMYDAWALSRSDPKYLLLLRRFLMDLHPEAVRRTIWLLSHVGSHPNIFWTKDNWIRPDAEQLLLPSFRWSPEELAHMVRAVDYSDYGRGTLGECLDVLLYEDPYIAQKLHLSIALLLKDSDHTQAVRAATLVLSHTRDQPKQLALIIADYPAMMEHEWFQDIAAAVGESGTFSVY
jgi:hypothetical protein